MTSSLDLDGIWKVRAHEGQFANTGAGCAEVADESRYMETQVPGEMHLELERMGLIPDCRIGMNAQSARWVEEQIWVYRKEFTAPPEACRSHAWLVFEGLDLDAAIYLNGEGIGYHANTHIPYRLDVTGKLKEGRNLLAVRLESGLYSVSEKSGAGYSITDDHKLHKRSWLRKPQYTFLWDWNPRLLNVGIYKPVRLEWTDTARIDAVTVYPELSADHSSAVLHGRLFIDSVYPNPVQATVRMRLPETGVTMERQIQLQPGMSRHDIRLDVAEPKLWWPAGHGDQPLYNVVFEVEVNSAILDTVERRTGIRSISIDKSPHPVEGEYFIIQVNGRPIFMKGANWAPPDAIYARPDADHNRRLVKMAADANFNAFRVNGVGLYLDNAAFDACDELGIMVWQDFPFGCSKYPGDDLEFARNVRSEATYMVRDRSHHPSLILWCGNNENIWNIWAWGFEHGKPYPDASMYLVELPRILHDEDPSRPYWPSTPYSEDFRHPTDPTTGTQHPWDVSIGARAADFWAYREDKSRCAVEGGVLGASSPATLRQFLPDEERHVWSRSWDFHDNAVNIWARPDLCRQMIEHWLEMDQSAMDLDTYAFYSGILQAEGLQEYANNFRRRMFDSSSAVFWQFNDSFPVSHGWSIVDHYLRRKIAYHPVRRVYAPVHVIPVIDGERVVIFGVNDTPNEWCGQLRFGIFRLAGGLPVDITASVTLAQNASSQIGEMPLSEWREVGENASGVFALLMQDGEVLSQNRLFISLFRDLQFEEPEITCTRDDGRAVFTSPTFVWGVCLDPNDEEPLPDDVFDLLPGIGYSVEWPNDRELPKIARWASLR
ncbi:MAG: beta-mannosidase [Armatimonadota bacterium]